MSEVIGTATIYGTYATAAAYIADRFGTRYAAWLELDPTIQKQTLVNAADYLNRQSWADVANTFVKRDALVDAEGRLVFDLASYELAVLVADDETITDSDDQGSNIQRVDAGGAGVTYFNPTSAQRGTATRLPQILMDLIGMYLGDSATGGPDGGDGQSGSDRNPFDRRHGDDRWRPF